MGSFTATNTTADMNPSLHKTSENQPFVYWDKKWKQIPLAYMTKWKKTACIKISNGDHGLKNAFFITLSFITVNLICQVRCIAAALWPRAETKANGLNVFSQCKQDLKVRSCDLSCGPKAERTIPETAGKIQHNITVNSSYCQPDLALVSPLNSLIVVPFLLGTPFPTVTGSDKLLNSAQYDCSCFCICKRRELYLDSNCNHFIMLTKSMSSWYPCW